MNHLTPDEIARLHGMSSQEVLERCIQTGVPVLHGRIDRTLFAAVAISEQIDERVPQESATAR